jgi:hypothetical protein
MASLLSVSSCLASRVSARRAGLSLFIFSSCVASRVSPRRATHFLLLRQEKVSKEKASLSQGRCAVPCAARGQRGRSQTRFAQTCARPYPLPPALLSPVSMASDANSQYQYQLRSLACGIANSLSRPHHLDASISERAPEGESAPARAIEAVPSSAALGGSGLALFERSEFSQTPPNASSAGNRAAARTPARLFFAYFLLAKQRKVSRPPGRDPA